MSRLLPLWWHPGMSHDSWTRNYRVRTLSFDQRAITYVNVRMKECLKMCLLVWHVCVCVYDQWDRWSASVDPECPKSRGRKWERYNYSRIVGCSRSKFLKNIPDRRTLISIFKVHARRFWSLKYGWLDVKRIIELKLHIFAKLWQDKLKKTLNGEGEYIAHVLWEHTLPHLCLVNREC